MNDKTKNIVNCVWFFAVLVGFMAYAIVLKDTDMSFSERRKLAKMPKPSVQNVFNGQFMTSFEKYALEQFPLRDSMRSIKANVSTKVLLKQDNNNIFVLQDEIYRVEYPLKSNTLKIATDKFNKIYEMYLNETNACYFSTIPDKSYFVAEKSGRPHIDYQAMQDYLKENIKNIQYIDIFDTLSKDDYYKTDTHWRQEKLQETVNKLSVGMGGKAVNFDNYTQNVLTNFKGVYYGQAAFSLPSESLVYLTNDTLQNASAYSHETKTEVPVYDTQKYKTDTDPYNLFLTGPATIIEITNHQANTDKHLVLFRDSFGSSIAPMLLENYKSITLVDIRYIPASMLKDYIDFKNKDILFLYSTLILNNAVALKI